MGYLDQKKTDELNNLKKERGIGNLGSEKNPFDYYSREYGTVPQDTKRAPFQWVSEVSYKNVHRIVTRGYDTTEIMEEGYGVIEVLFVDYQARFPTVEEGKMLNYVMIMMLEDGISGPAAISRIVATSKTFLTLAETAELLVRENGIDEALGVSSLMLKDSSAKRMIARAEKLGVAGKNIDFMKEVVKAAQAASSESVDVDMLGATGSVMQDLGFTPEATWAILAITRAFGVGAHYIEEVERNELSRLGQQLSPKENYDGVPKRPVPPLKDRAKIAVSAVCQTPQEWKARFEKMKEVKGSGFSIIEEVADPSKKSGMKKVGKL